MSSGVPARPSAVFSRYSSTTPGTAAAGAVNGVWTKPGDGVDADAARAELQSGDLRQHRKACLGRAVGAHARRGLAAVQRADRDERAAGAQVAARVLGDDERAGEADVDDVAELVDGHVGDQADVGESRAVDDDVDLADLLEQS